MATRGSGRRRREQRDGRQIEPAAQRGRRGHMCCRPGTWRASQTRRPAACAAMLARKTGCCIKPRAGGCCMCQPHDMPARQHWQLAQRRLMLCVGGHGWGARLDLLGSLTSIRQSQSGHRHSPMHHPPHAARRPPARLPSPAWRRHCHTSSAAAAGQPHPILSRPAGRPEHQLRCPDAEQTCSSGGSVAPRAQWSVKQLRSPQYNVGSPFSAACGLAGAPGERAPFSRPATALLCLRICIRRSHIVIPGTWMQ